MREIRFILDSDGRRRAVLRELKDRGGSPKDLYDLLPAEDSEDEDRIPDEESAEERPEVWR